MNETPTDVLFAQAREHVADSGLVFFRELERRYLEEQERAAQLSLEVERLFTKVGALLVEVKEWRSAAEIAISEMHDALELA